MAIVLLSDYQKLENIDDEMESFGRRDQPNSPETKVSIRQNLYHSNIAW